MSERRILVVEDQMLLLRMMEGLLEDLGCTEVHSAATVDQALALIENHDFDAVVLDLNLNGTMSYPVADVLSYNGVPFMFVTGYGKLSIPSPHDERPILSKPYRHSQAAEALERLLASDAISPAVECGCADD
jgi:CheY-like chemotaxis protein